jgi:hypothetical protein
MLTVLRSAKSLHPAYVDSVSAICRTFSVLRCTTTVDGEFDDFDPNEYPAFSIIKMKQKTKKKKKKKSRVH